jgi:CDP-diacylglycerol--glycerol-3-phosphate 3-phosphatidyltransferase
MKSLPNYLTFSRIILSLALIFIKPFSITFYVIYVICGLSDIFDGLIARKTGSASSSGAKLDTVADLVMVGILLVIYYPAIHPPIQFIIWIGFICLIRFASMITAFIKYNTFASIHTYGNKMTGLALFMLPLLLIFINLTILGFIMCLIASLSALEELIIMMRSSELNVNRKTLIH